MFYGAIYLRLGTNLAEFASQLSREASYLLARIKRRNCAQIKNIQSFS
jgi:hypothetical protein